MGALLAQLLGALQAYIVSPLLWLLPLKWAVVLPGEAAVRFTCGRLGPDLSEPGVYFATSCQMIRKLHVRLHVLESDTVSSLTKDLVPLEVEAIVTYRIYSLGKFLTQTVDSPTYLSTAAEAVLLDAVRGCELIDITERMEELQGGLCKTLGREMDSIGVEVQTARIQDVRHLDPVARAMSAAEVVAERLSEGVAVLQANHCVGTRDALAALSNSIQYVMPLRHESDEPSDDYAGGG